MDEVEVADELYRKLATTGGAVTPHSGRDPSLQKKSPGQCLATGFALERPPKLDSDSLLPVILSCTWAFPTTCRARESLVLSSLWSGTLCAYTLTDEVARNGALQRYFGQRFS
jgi:hypothetical protein